MTVMAANDGTFLTWSDVLEYLDGCYTLTLFMQRCDMFQDQRLGQAFFNSLPKKDQAILRGSLEDPFYKDDKRSVIVALEYILSH